MIFLNLKTEIINIINKYQYLNDNREFEYLKLEYSRQYILIIRKN